MRDETPMDDEVIPGHILRLICAVHLRQDHGYKAWTTARFRERFPGCCTGDDGFEFTALHVLHHTQVGDLARDDLGPAGPAVQATGEARPGPSPSVRERAARCSGRSGPG